MTRSLNVAIAPCKELSGAITAPPSKSRTHRALIAGLLSTGTSTIENPLSCDDTKATLHAAVAFGAQINRDQKLWTVRSDGHPRKPDGEICCGESAATLRFMASIASLTGEKVVLTGRDSLMRRPLAPLIEALGEIGVTAKLSEEKLVVQGRADGGVAHIRGDVSSQFISGLLFAGPLMSRGLEIELTTLVESRNYILQTLQTMKQHGIDVKSDPNMSAFQIDGGQTYSPADHRVSGDYSSAAFALAAAAITGAKLFVRNLPRNDQEPDSLIIDILSRMGAETHVADDGISVEGSQFKGLRVNLRDNPDLCPVMVVLGVFANGETIIEGAKRLRHKESDRLEAISTELNSLGANIKTTEDGLRIRGPSSLSGGSVDSHGDHRIAMALAVAALNAKSNVEIRRAECVSKSYPNFFEDLRSVGVEVIER